MRKLKLELEALAVESFDVDVPADRGGTVRGAEITVPLTCATDEYQSCEGSCDGGCSGGCGSGWYSCEASCGGGCGTDENTCYQSCEAVDTCFPANC
jgi:hypothetical protein